MVSRARRQAEGFSYLAVLFAMLLIGLALGVTGQVWHIQVQREREEQLLWVGHQYRNALEQYWLAGASNVGPAAGANGTAGGGAAGAGGSAGSPGGGFLPGQIIQGGSNRLPTSLDNLLADPRTPTVRRFLRQRYRDPITGKDDWVLIRAPGGGILGLRSASSALPIKQSGFDPEDNQFFNRKHYSDWTFVFVPPGFPNLNAGPTVGGSIGNNLSNPANPATPAAPVPQPNSNPTPLPP